MPSKESPSAQDQENTEDKVTFLDELTLSNLKRIMGDEKYNEFMYYASLLGYLGFVMVFNILFYRGSAQPEFPCNLSLLKTQVMEPVDFKNRLSVNHLTPPQIVGLPGFQQQIMLWALRVLKQADLKAVEAVEKAFRQRRSNLFLSGCPWLRCIVQG